MAQKSTTESTPENVLITGFPGFIGERLVKQLLVVNPAIRIVALVQQKFMGVADRSRSQIESADHSVKGRIEIVEGDITRPDIGLADGDAVADRIREIFHLAALYDLTCGPAIAEKINVEGTQNIVDFAAKCGNLVRHHYISTCYVSGDYGGKFSEDDFDFGQGFHNHYERTKFLAEKVVRQSMDLIPTTIYRPAIVVGDSSTGETAKFDGPYQVIGALHQLPRFAPFFQIGAGLTPVNIVPVDFLIDAIVELSRKSASAGKCYQIADSAPLTCRDLTLAICDQLQRSKMLIHVPRKIVEFTIRPKFMQNLFDLTLESIPYFDHPTEYTTDRLVADLDGSSIRCPRFLDYLPNLLRFWLEKRAVIRRGAMA